MNFKSGDYVKSLYGNVVYRILGLWWNGPTEWVAEQLYPYYLEVIVTEYSIVKLSKSELTYFKLMGKL